MTVMKEVWVWRHLTVSGFERRIYTIVDARTGVDEVCLSIPQVVAQFKAWMR